MQRKTISYGAVKVYIGRRILSPQTAAPLMKHIVNADDASWLGPTCDPSSNRPL